MHAIADARVAVNQFLALTAGQCFWPELMAPARGGSDPEVAQMVVEVVTTLIARYSTRH